MSSEAIAVPTGTLPPSAATSAVAPRSRLQRFATSHATAATCAGILEIAFFHPFDTAAKRLMANKGSIMRPTFGETASHVNSVIFKQHAHSNILAKLLYLYPGSLYAVFYKVLQRVYKFAGQPIVRDYLGTHYRSSFKNTFGKSHKVVEDATAGCLIGMGEVILLPLDRLKVLSQTNEGALRRGLWSLLRQEGMRGMYAGTAVTLCRNAPGSFCLFGGAAWTKSTIFHLQDPRRASFFQNMCASTVGACLSIAVSNPMDVIKTRIQRQTAEQGKTKGALGMAVSMLREEGAMSYFKGLTPKLVASAPKLIFAYTMTEFFYLSMNRYRQI